MIEKIIFVPLYGRINEFVTIADALQFLDQHDIYKGSGDFLKYEILVKFSNGDHVEGTFRDKEKVQKFLQLVASQ